MLQVCRCARSSSRLAFLLSFSFDMNLCIMLPPIDPPAQVMRRRHLPYASSAPDLKLYIGRKTLMISAVGPILEIISSMAL